MGYASTKPKIDFHDLEKQLASQLRQACDENGKEIDPSISGPILHKLGKLYWLKSIQGSHLVTLIQSAALYNAALARSTSNSKNIEKDLQQLCKYVLVQSKAKNPNSNLIQHSKVVKAEFEMLRKKVKQKLKSITQITETTTKDELKNLEKQKIAVIRDLQNYITENYAKIMADLAKYCHLVLGNAPCRFAIIGMGSLARKEITPYSDFEHTIALEDEVTKVYTSQETEEVVIPYFKWFSTIFHIVIINLQETVLPSVAISSLNDFYTEVTKDNWFFDAITTRGVSFDGLMPHACKLPIGRQKSTKQKPWKTELIKPVKNMLQYLTAESQLKQGYHLGDILTKTCFIFGDQTIYDQFNAGVIKILDNQPGIERIEFVKRQINDDLESFATRNILFNMFMKNEINIKKVVYRSSTIFISAMARLFSVQKSSCFEIIEKLEDMQEITKYAKHKQMYAVALACEMRLRWYMHKKRQTDAIIVENGNEKAVSKLFSIVGKRSTVCYFQIVYALQCDISKRLNLKKLHFHSNPQLLNFNISICLMDSNQAKMCVSKSEIQRTKYNRLFSFDECLQLLENGLDFTDTSLEVNDNTKFSSTFEEVLNAGDTLYRLDCYDDALEYYQKSLQILVEGINIASNDLDSSWSKVNVLCKARFDIAELLSFNLKRVGECLMETNKTNLALKYLLQSAAIQREMPVNDTTDIQMSSLLHVLGQCYAELNELNEAQKYFKQSIRIDEKVTTNAEVDLSLASTLHELARCLQAMNKHDEALKYFEKALQIKQNATKNAETDKKLAVTLHALGQCLLDTNQHNEAYTYFKRALVIKEQLTTYPETDRNLASTFHELGRCLFNMDLHDEAIKYFEKALQIKERATTNAETDTNIAVTLHSLGNCFLDINKQFKAFKYFEKALQIFESAAKNVDANASLANALHEVGQCLAEMSQFDDAANYFERALQIKKQAIENFETDANLVTTSYYLEQCLQNITQHHESYPYFKKTAGIQNQATNVKIEANSFSISNDREQCLVFMNQHNDESALQTKQTAASASKHTKLAITLHVFGKYLFDINQQSKAFKYFDRALQIFERITTNQEIDTNFVTTTMHELGHCLLHITEHSKILTYFDQALLSPERETAYVANAAEPLHILGQCLFNINQHKKALKYFKRALQIKEQMTTNSKTDKSLANIMHEIGRCLLKINQHKKALKYFEKALQIYEQTTKNAENDMNLAVILQGLDQCLLKKSEQNQTYAKTLNLLLK